MGAEYGRRRRAACEAGPVPVVRRTHDMYSWFLRDAPAPDVLLTVGSGRAVYQFAGHRALLASHSGYLKAQLVTDTHTVVVPNVAPEVFAPLLTFMYTGYLDLTPDNVYAVLLATHLLHMPRALDLCRTFLVRSRPPTLVKPVPSRKSLPSLLCGSQPAYWTPPPLLPPAHSTVTEAPFRPAFPPLPDAAAVPSTQNPGPDAVPSTSAERQPSTPPSSLSPCLSDASDRVTITVPRVKGSGTKDGNVIVDVASCDGPVRFRRVLNRNYGQSASAPTDGPVFTCRFCGHTFKSRYCYRKHARRHLDTLPVETAEAEVAKRRVSLPDTNVQYYPCKTCGSKFPSYYFVHKHRKMCHPSDESQSDPPSSAAAAAPPCDSESSQLTV